MKYATNWTPFKNCLGFGLETSRFLSKCQDANVEILCTLWAAMLVEFGTHPSLITMTCIVAQLMHYLLVAFFTYDSPLLKIQRWLGILKLNGVLERRSVTEECGV